MLTTGDIAELEQGRMNHPPYAGALPRTPRYFGPDEVAKHWRAVVLIDAFLGAVPQASEHQASG